MEIKLLAQLVRKAKFIDFFVQDLQAIGEIEGIHNIIDPEITNETIQKQPYVYIHVPNMESARRILTRSVLIHSLSRVFGEGRTLEDAKKAVNKEAFAKFLAETPGSVAFHLDSSNKTWKGSKLDALNSFMKEFNLGERKIDLKKPDLDFKLIEVYENSDMPEPMRSFFMMEVMRSPSAQDEFSLSDRMYMGPTTTDHNLAFLMANQALVTPGTFVYDPFCGTCGILLICAHFGDLDIRVLKGMGVARMAGTVEGVETGNVFTNYDIYKLPHPDIVRMDFTQPSLRKVELFDAVVCDPPYGIRAASKQFGQHSKKKPKLMLSEEEYLRSHIGG